MSELVDSQNSHSEWKAKISTGVRKSERIHQFLLSNEEMIL